MTRSFGATRVVFNDFVARRNEVHTQGIREDFNDTRAKVLVHSKKTPERAWLKNYSAIALQSSVQNAINGYLKFYKELEKKNTTGKTPRRISPPKFKSKRSDQAATFRDKRFIKVNKLNKTFSETNIPRIGWVKCRDTRDLPAQPKSMTISKDKTGAYYVSFHVEETLSESKVKIQAGERTIATGVDLGLIDLTTEASSDGTRRKTGNPRHLRQAERRLKIAQRRLSKKMKGSMRREKQRRILAKQHKKVSNIRQDHLRKTAHRLSSENQVLALETLNVAGMVKNHRLAKSISDASLATLVSYIKWSAEKQFTEVRQIGRFEPTSQVCSQCGIQQGPKPLDIRVWQCPDCFEWLDRDFNAALSILLAAGLADSLNARGGDIRRSLAQAEESASAMSSNADSDEARSHLTHL